MASIELTLTAQSTDLGDENYSKLFDLTVNGLEVYPKHDELAIPWDAVLSIEGSDVVMDGYVAGGGPSSGTSVAKIPLNKVMRVIGLSVYVEDEESEEEVRRIFEEHHWL